MALALPGPRGLFSHMQAALASKVGSRVALRKGDCSWATIKLVLGWVIDTERMTIHLPPHCVERLAKILVSIPVTQKRTSVKKWH